MLIKDIMTKNPITIEADSTVMEAERVLSLNKIGRLIVVENGDIVGVLTDGDLMNNDDINENIDKYMTRDVITIKELDTVQKAAKVLSDNQIGGMPVINKEDELVDNRHSTDLVI